MTTIYRVIRNTRSQMNGRFFVVAERRARSRDEALALAESWARDLCLSYLGQSYISVRHAGEQVAEYGVYSAGRYRVWPRGAEPVYVTAA